uniref:Uncharacterized protein n=1 Tax=Rhizophora mucronata TaxID=61149 RepID=A0A2P2NSS9_RHIMU
MTMVHITAAISSRIIEVTCKNLNSLLNQRLAQSRKTENYISQSSPIQCKEQ